LKFRNYKDTDDEQIVLLLNTVFANWGTVNDWQKKYKLSSNFDPSLIFLTEDNGKIVSCVHYLRRDILVGNAVLKTYIGGDGATLPEYSGQGLFSKNLKLLYKEIQRRNGSAVYGFNTEGIYKNYYRKNFGEVAIYRPHVFIKVIDYPKFLTSVLPAANRLIGPKISILRDKHLTFRLVLDEVQIDVFFGHKKIKICKLASADLTIKTTTRELSNALVNRRYFLSAVILGKIRFQLSVFAIPKIFKILIGGLQIRR
jgi:hypothetical protein